MKLFYKIYFWVFLTFSCDILLHALRSFELSFSDIGSVFFTLTCPIFLFLYAFNRNWLPLYFWKAFTLVYLASQIFYFFKHITAQDSFENIAAAFVLFFPLYAAMFIYSFGKKQVR